MGTTTSGITLSLEDCKGFREDSTQENLPRLSASQYKSPKARFTRFPNTSMRTTRRTTQSLLVGDQVNKGCKMLQRESYSSEIKPTPLNSPSKQFNSIKLQKETGSWPASTAFIAWLGEQPKHVQSKIRATNRSFIQNLNNIHGSRTVNAVSLDTKFNSDILGKKKTTEDAVKDCVVEACSSDDTTKDSSQP